MFCSFEFFVLDGFFKVVLKYSVIIMMNGVDDNIVKMNILFWNFVFNFNYYVEFDICKGLKKVVSNSCSVSGVVVFIWKVCDYNIVVVYVVQGVYVVVVGVLFRELWVFFIKEFLGSNIFDVDGVNLFYCVVCGGGYGCGFWVYDEMNV